MRWITANQGFSEIFTSDGAPRPHYGPLVGSIEAFTRAEIERRRSGSRPCPLSSQGVTFTISGEKEGLERILPFDFVPRIIPAAEWKIIQDGLVQRITALNLFLLDIYQTQNCLRDGVIPAELILSRKEFKRPLLGIVPPRKIFTHVVGTDIIRDDRGDYLVLDNCRVPSGVSYVLENRQLLSRVFPELFASYPVRPINDTPRSCSRPWASWPRGPARVRWR